MSDAHIDKIRSRGYWRVVISPSTFVDQRVPNILDLPRILQSCAVSLRGWDYPNIDSRAPDIGEDWVGQGIDWEGYVEYWRFYQSGQFLHLDGFKEDWADQRRMFGSAPKWPKGERLEVVSAVFSFTEIFELASRLSMSQAGSEATYIEIRLHGLTGRQLRVESQKRNSFPRPYSASVAEFRHQREYSKGELAASAWFLALEPATDLFRRFGWDPPREVLDGMQEELRSFRRSIGS